MPNQENQPMTMQRQRVGLHNVGSYQVSGQPWLTSSAFTRDTTLTCSFPFVTQRITVMNKGENVLRISFGKGGAQGQDAVKAHYTTIPAMTAGGIDNTFTFEVKCKEVFITEPDEAAASVEVFASLTGIPTASMYNLTGRGLDD